MNIVVVSMDGVRPDYLTHAFFDRVKSQGLEFTNCIAQASHTSTSHTSILTGQYPFNHGVRWLVDYENKSRTVQEILKREGYFTAAFIGGFPLSKGNMDKGFDRFEYEEVIDDVKEGREKFMPANVIVNKAVNWMEQVKSNNKFVFLHFFDAHLMLRSEFGNGQWPEKDENGIFIDLEPHLGRRRRRYQEEVDFISQQMELLVDLADIDLLVVTADHGTKMQGDRNYPWVYNSNGNRIGTQFHVAELFDIQLHIPLLFWGKHIENKCISKMVRSIDIMPTILDVADIPCPAIDGVSLLKNNSPKFAYSETYFAQVVESNKRVVELNEKSSWGWADVDSLVSIRSNEYKLICTANESLEPFEFYNIKEDPLESRNLLNDEASSSMKEDLLQNLTELIKNDSQMDIENEAMRKDIRERLEDLGYL